MKKRLSLITTIALLFVIRSGAQNLVTNSGFDSGLANWNKNINGTKVKANFSILPNGHEGGNSFQANVQALGANPWDIMLMQDLSTVKGESYELSFYGKADVEGVKIRPQFQNTTYTATDITLTTEWKKYTFQITAKEDNLELVFQLFEVGNIYLDAIQVVKKAKPERALLLNGGFENDTQGWTSYASDGANAKFTVIDSGAKEGNKTLTALVLVTGKNSWSVASSTPFPSLKYKKYKLTFYAKSSTPGSKLTAQIQKTTYSPKQFTLSTEWQQYEYIFPAKENDMEVAFHYLDSGLYYLDGVHMELLTKPKVKKKKKKKQ